MTESLLQSGIRNALALVSDLRLYRNNSGMSIRGGHKRRAIRYGLFNALFPTGSSDLVGILKPSGRFIALEVKRPGQKLKPEQEAWLADAREFGAFAAVVDSIESAFEALERARRGEVE
jgi:hypothetical protein